MRHVRAARRVGIRQWVILGVFALGVLAATCLSPAARGDDEDILFQQRRNHAQAALESRMQARFAAGWTPKSRDEQLVTSLRRLMDSRVRQQEIAQTRAAFESARAEVYVQLARHYTTIGSYRRGYVYTYGQDRVTGAYRPYVQRNSYWVLDPLAARLSAHFGSKAARSKGIAAAQEYHANTYFERQIRNTNNRIAQLQQQISLKAQLAKMP